MVQFEVTEKGHESEIEDWNYGREDAHGLELEPLSLILHTV